MRYFRSHGTRHLPSVVLPMLLAAGLAMAASPTDAAQPAKANTAAMQTWQSNYDQAQSAYAAGDLTTAERAAREALKQAREGHGATGSYIASSLNLLAFVRAKQGHADEAVDLLSQALRAAATVPDNQANTAALALNLGRALEAQGQINQALVAYQRSADTGDGQPAKPQTASVRAQALQALGRLYAERGDTARAEQYNRQLLADAQSLSRAQQVEALRRQARLQQGQGQSAAAIASLTQALDLYRNPSAEPADAENADATANRIAVLTELAALYDSQGQYDQAEPLHRQAVALLEKTDPQGKALAAHLNELGLWHLQRKEYPQAETLMQQALAIVEKQDAASLETARIVANLAQLNEAQRQDEPAQALYKKALGIYQSHGEEREALLGQAQALNFLAGQDYRKRRFGQAEPQFLKALALTEQADGENSPRLLPLLDNLVALYRSQQRSAQAAPYAERAERLRQELEAASGPAKAG